MEVEDTSELSQSSNSVTVGETVWKYIYNPIIGIFSDLENAASERSLCSLLESFLRGSTNLVNILVPPYGVGNRYECLQQQYSAFTTWLFGTMFYVVGALPSKEVFSNSIEVQACMLRILSRHYQVMFDAITSEYMAILDELLNFSESNLDAECIVISRFRVERGIVDNLDLTSFPVEIKRSRIPTIQISIMKIILKSEVTQWEQSELRITIFRILVDATPEVKVVALEVATQMIKFGTIENEDLSTLINYTIEIVKTIPSWKNLGMLPDNLLLQYSKEFINLIDVLNESSSVTELCFCIIALIIYDNVIESELLEYTACYKIRQHLTINSMPYTISEAKKYIRYSKNCQNFTYVLMHFIFHDVKNLTSRNEAICVAEISIIWNMLKEDLIANVRSERFKQSLNTLESSRLLDSWLTDDKIPVQLYGPEINIIFELFVQYLNSDNNYSMQLLFENVINLMAHCEMPKVQIQEILALPWVQDVTLSFEVSRHLKAVAKSLDVTTKIKCLETLCEFGRGKWRLQILNTCVSNSEMELAIASIQNSILLLKDADIKLKDIVEYILRPALTSQKQKLHEALVDVLGQIVCFLSDCTTFVRESWSSTKWIIRCECCDKDTNLNLINVHNFPVKYNNLLSPFFDLLTTSMVEVRLNMSKNFLKFSNHVQRFNSNDMAKMWLPYIQDTNFDVRLNVAKVFGVILKNRIRYEQQNTMVQSDDVSAELNDFVDLTVDTMVNALTDAVETPNHLLHETLLITAKEFACVPLHLVERRALNIFLITILHPSSTTAAVAYATVVYQEVAAFHNVSPKAMYIRYRKDFIELMMKMAVRNHIVCSYNMATSLHRVAKCIGYQGSRQLLRKDGHYAVCFLLSFVIQEPKAITLFHDVAELITMNEKQMFVEYFQHICPYVFLNIPYDIGRKCLHLVSNITKLDLPDLMRRSFMGIFSELLLYFHKETDKVIQCLEILSKFDGEHKGKFDTRDHVATYLKPRLHGVLVNLDVNLGPRSDEYTQQSALASLAVLIRFMGAKYVTPLRYKILATLRTSLGFKRPGFRQLACEAWSAFLHNTFVEDLGPLLPTICVSLIPLLENYPEKGNAMLEFLIIENNRAIANNIPELFFIDDINTSSKISDAVKEHIEQARPEGVEENLKLWLKRITHETDKVRFKALVHLQTFLAEHRSELNDMILSDTDVHPLIVELLDTLLAGCRDKDETIRLACGECLGELGAIEPSLLPRRIVSRDDSKFIFDMNEEFACAALIELVRAFQTQKNTQSMDCFSLAIQEILKTYNIMPQGSNSHLWNNFPLTMQQMISPFLTSHYKITTTYDDNQFPHPIYGSEAGSTFDKWAYNWVCGMSSNVRDKSLGNVLNACRPAFKRDMRTLIFCIPYIVSYIVANGTEEDRTKLIDEMLTVINVSEQTILDQELLHRRPLRYQFDTRHDTRISDEARRVRCSQVIFSTLDHLQRWLRERRLNRDEKYEAMRCFCNNLNSLVLAEGCYRSYEYHRALIYLEQHMASSNKGLSESVEGGLLAKIYAQLEEPDGVSGILAAQNQSPTLQELVLAHEVNGQLQDAATCYERLAQEKMSKPKYLQGMVQCYLGLDHPFTAMNITEGVLDNRPELEPLMVEYDSFWRLAHFTRMDDTKQKTIKQSLLDDFKKGLKPDLQSIKKRLVSLLGAASHQGAYQQSYSYIMKLHILNEFEKASSMMLENVENLPMIFEEWEKRGQLVRASRGIESVLSMRRATLDLAVQLQQETSGTKNTILNEEIGKIWLKSAKMARKAGLYQQAYMYILSASDSCPPQDLYIEQAQLYWQKGCQEDAFATLKRCFSNCFHPLAHYKEMSSDLCIEERRKCAKAKLLFAKYNDETLNVDTDGNITNYREAIEVWKAWEKSLLSCAQYYETVVNGMFDDERDTKGRDLQVHMMTYYGKSLQYGCKYVHQSMPRMLTIWLDFASRMQCDKSLFKSCSESLSKMTKIIEVYMDRLPIFMWLTAFSQLVSRICHPAKEVQNTLCAILVKLILAYPQHCLWMMASVFKSSYPMRQRRCQEILNHVKLKTSEMTKLIQDFNKLWERLIELSNKSIPDGMAFTTVNSLSKNLPRLLSSSDFSKIMIPTTKFRQLHLPPKGESTENHNPFTTQWVHIAGIEDNVMVMASLQRPKRITIRGSDGGHYIFMCKPKDDLRKDFRLMEFNDIVNKYLQKDPESRQRRLYIRTYSVVPLNEECGLIEWVPNLLGFRPIVMTLYKEKGIALTNRELKSMICGLKDPLEKKRQVFVEKLLPCYPPVLGEWFRLSFPDPYGWYEARTAYIRTTAVMSMVGYILGLGDRHGENILFDSKCGDCVHVDFNCLFDRGELFDWPERVPFRLTQNMVEAMGPLKCDGPFRRACQTTMRVLRQQATTLLSVLTPFVYDPLVSWNKNQPEAGEKTNKKAVEHIKNIDQRLKGLIRSQEKKLKNIALNLSVEGQTNHLILEATNIDNLCQMYFGWGPYL